MWLWHRHQTTKLSVPVEGHPVRLPEISQSDSEVVFATKPTNLAVNAPLNGEVLALSRHAIRLVALNGQTYWLRLTHRINQASQFDWQVRVGDTVSPLTILGTLNQAAIDSAVVVCERQLETNETTTPREFLGVSPS